MVQEEDVPLEPDEPQEDAEEQEEEEENEREWRWLIVMYPRWNEKSGWRKLLFLNMTSLKMIKIYFWTWFSRISKFGIFGA